MKYNKINVNGIQIFYRECGDADKPNFINGSTNASAESINAKMKGFRSEIHGIQDLPFS